jgi:hypothetical protein
VDVEDESGKVLKTLSFTIGGADAPQGASN